MKNIYLIYQAQRGYVLPELWYLQTRDDDLYFVFTKLCWEIIQKIDIPGWEYEKPSLKSRWGVHEGFSPVKKEAGLYVLRISLMEQVGDGVTGTQEALASSLAVLTEVLNIFVVEQTKQKRQPKDREQLQLFSLQTYHTSDEALMHGSGMTVSISPEAASFLLQQSPRAIPGAHEAMKNHHLARYPAYKNKERLSADLTGVVREKGVLHFVTWGSNCACLGSNGHESQESGKGKGLFIDSHNINTPWQQLSMLIAIGVTWKWVRTSLGYK